MNTGRENSRLAAIAVWLLPLIPSAVGIPISLYTGKHQWVVPYLFVCTLLIYAFRIKDVIQKRAKDD